VKNAQYRGTHFEYNFVYSLVFANICAIILLATVVLYILGVVIFSRNSNF